MCPSPTSDPAPKPPHLLPVTVLRGVGEKLAEKLLRLGIRTVQDVLFHLPLRYQDRTRVHPIGALLPGAECLLVGTVDHSEVVYRRRRMMLVRISDGTGSILLRFFHFSASQQKQFSNGAQVRCFGEVRDGQTMREIVHPEYKVLNDSEVIEVQDTLTAVYPATEGVQQPTLRKLSDEALRHLPRVQEWLPQELRDKFRLPTLQQALMGLHRPDQRQSRHSPLNDESPERLRLVVEELLAHQLAMVKLRNQARETQAQPVKVKGLTEKAFLKQLPFTLTGAQQRTHEQIKRDLSASLPMMRLVQGDVGSGKTVVAALACLQVVEAGHQAAVMAPTEILAEQHYSTFRNWLEPLGIEIAWLSGKQGAKQRREMLAKLISGDAAIAVGTHALFQKEVLFRDLVLAVVDEQHRFGVHQRMALREKGRDGLFQPHQLIMTATPIPRTLAMTAYADLDVSVIDELPPGRKPIKTVVMAEAKRPELISHVAEACREGHQCYWVCTLVEESEVLQAQAAEGTCEQLGELLPDLTVGLVHGRMKPTEKKAVMSLFKRAELDVLVATTVIEVGVDVPNASLMIIENAERLGLSQLHQLRGRVGRGSVESSCVLLYQPPLSATGKIRLSAMRETNDGFRIAEIDLELRGPGELLGTRQTGELTFRIADFERDEALIPELSEMVGGLAEAYPEMVEPLIDRWIGEKQQYREV